MKKLFCLLLACMMLLSLSAFASADTDLETALADVDLEAPEFSPAEKTVLDRASLSGTTDVVTLSDTGIEVKTEDGLRISYTYPNEDVVGLSQDLMQQSFLYLLFFSDNMSSVANEFVEDGMHLNIYDFQSGMDIYLYAGTCTLSALVPDLNALSESDVLVIENLLATNYFEDAVSISTGMVGSNLWIFADYGNGGYVVTYVNGVEVFCSFAYVDSTGPVQALTLLENLSISAA